MQNRDAFLRCLIYYSIPIVAESMVNQFGNYLFQSVLELAGPIELESIVDEIETDMSYIASDDYGTRVVQTLVSRLVNGLINGDQPQIFDQTLRKVVNSLSQQAHSLIIDLNGNHVIQNILREFNSNARSEGYPSETYTDFIFNACMESPVNIAVHRHGCCVMQRCLEKGGPREQKLGLATYIVDNFDFLVEDQFGNYAVQNVILLEDRDLNTRIFKKLSKDFIRFSIMKFSSNVIEKCFDSKACCDEKTGEPLVDQFFMGTLKEVDDHQIVR